MFDAARVAKPQYVSSDAYDTDILEFEGRKFEVCKYPDVDGGPPWEEMDGCGIIESRYSGYGRPEKKPGEVLIHNHRGDYWVYDWAGTIKKAHEEGWGLSVEETAALARKLKRAWPTKRQIVAESVRRDMERNTGWLRDDWWWIGVGVRLIGPDGKPQGDCYEHALWRVESDGDYWKEVAKELASDILHEKRKAWRKALKERRERRYWASRDIVTV